MDVSSLSSSICCAFPTYLSSNLVLVLIVFGSYFFGSIPFGLLLTRAAGLGDIRQIGSGNIGATNVLRTGNKKLAALTLLLDALKGVAAIYFSRAVLIYYARGTVVGDVLSKDDLAISLFFVVLGHMYPVWLKFKGGKGVATFIGATTAINWPIGVVIMLTWLVTAACFRYSSLAALVAVGFAPLDFFIFKFPEHQDNWGPYIAFFRFINFTYLEILILIIVFLIFLKHRANIVRLINHTEPKIILKKNAPPPPK